MARRLHAAAPTGVSAAWRAAALIAFAGCVVPTPLEIAEEEPEPNYPPAIRTMEPPSGPVTIPPGDQGREFSLAIEDANAGDTLYLRWFRDWTRGRPTPAFMQRTVPPSDAGLPRRLEPPQTITCDLLGEGEEHLLEVVIADRLWLDPHPRNPTYRELPDEARSTIGVWWVTCPRGTP